MGLVLWHTRNHKQAVFPDAAGFLVSLATLLSTYRICILSIPIGVVGLSLASGSTDKQKTVFPKWLSLEKETMRELNRAVVRPSESCGT